MKKHDIVGLKLDQHDAATLRSKLQLHAANLRGMVHAEKGQLIDAPKMSGNDVIADVGALESHCTELEAILGGSAPPFNFSAEPQQSGGNQPRPPGCFVSSSGSSAASHKKPVGAASNLTAKILAAKGVNSLNELRAQSADLTPEQRAKNK